MSLLLPSLPPMPGSQWLELVIHTSLARPERWGNQRHGSEDHWDWGRTLATKLEAWRRRTHLERIARNLTPEQRDALWSDPSDEARELRRVCR